MHSLSIPEPEQQVEFFAEEFVVVLEVIAKEREGLGEGSPARHDLRTPIGQKVKSGEILKDPDGIIRAQHRHGAGQSDMAGPHRCGGEDDGRRRDGEIWTVMLTHAKNIEADLVGQLDLLQQIAQTLGRRHHLTGRGIRCRLCEGVNAEFHESHVE